MTGCAATAEDLTQEVFVKVVRSVDSYREQEREVAWVFRIARNVLIDRYRQRKREAPSVSLEAAPPTVVSGSRPADALTLQDAIERLPEPEREAFLLRELGGFGYEEIGRITLA